MLVAVTVQLEKEPGYLYLRRTIRPKFVKLGAPYEPPVTSPAPPSLIPSGFYGPSLLVDIALNKYLDHLPLYRIEQRYVRPHGVKIPRLDDERQPRPHRGLGLPGNSRYGAGAVGHRVCPGGRNTYPLPGSRAPGWRLSRVLVDGDRSTGQRRHFPLAESRGLEVFKDWLPADFRGVVQRDGCSAYATLARKRGADVLWAGCWAHARRKLLEAATAGDRVAAWFVHQIALLYAVEKRARETELSAVLRQRERAVTSGMVLARLKRACLRMASRVRPTSLLGKALSYALSQWQALEVYGNRGDIEIDNNQVENAIRPTAVGKKNWLFIGAPDAGSKAATFYTLIGSCLRRELNPRDYLIWLFARLPTATNQSVADLTPAAFAKLQVGAGALPQLAQPAA